MTDPLKDSLAELRDLLDKADETVDSDSNDAEIEALREALDAALEIINTYIDFSYEDRVGLMVRYDR